MPDTKAWERVYRAGGSFPHHGVSPFITPPHEEEFMTKKKPVYASKEDLIANFDRIANWAEENYGPSVPSLARGPVCARENETGCVF